MENTETIYSRLFLNDDSKIIKEKSLNSLYIYYQTFDLIERTYIALGKRKSYAFSSHSTSNGRINTNAIASTTEI